LQTIKQKKIIFDEKIQPGVRISRPAKLTNNLFYLLVCPRTKVYFWHSSIKKQTHINQKIN